MPTNYNNKKYKYKLIALSETTYNLLQKHGDLGSTYDSTVLNLLKAVENNKELQMVTS